MDSVDVIAAVCVVAALLIVALEAAVERSQRDPQPTPGRKRLP